MAMLRRLTADEELWSVTVPFIFGDVRALADAPKFAVGKRVRPRPVEGADDEGQDEPAAWTLAEGAADGSELRAVTAAAETAAPGTCAFAPPFARHLSLVRAPAAATATAHPLDAARTVRPYTQPAQRTDLKVRHRPRGEVVPGAAAPAGAGGAAKRSAEASPADGAAKKRRKLERSAEKSAEKSAKKAAKKVRSRGRSRGGPPLPCPAPLDTALTPRPLLPGRQEEREEGEEGCFQVGLLWEWGARAAGRAAAAAGRVALRPCVLTLTNSLANPDSRPIYPLFYNSSYSSCVNTPGRFLHRSPAMSSPSLSCAKRARVT